VRLDFLAISRPFREAVCEEWGSFEFAVMPLDRRGRGASTISLLSHGLSRMKINPIQWKAGPCGHAEVLVSAAVCHTNITYQWNCPKEERDGLHCVSQERRGQSEPQYVSQSMAVYLYGRMRVSKIKSRALADGEVFYIFALEPCQSKTSQT
jgi:hypothetical protein